MTRAALTLALLAEQPGLTSEHVACVLGIEHSAAASVLSLLHLRGRVTRRRQRDLYRWAVA